MQGRARFAWPEKPRRPHLRSTGCARRSTLSHETATTPNAVGELSLAPFKWLAPPATRALLEGFCSEPPQDEQVAVNSNGQMLFLRLAEIKWVQAADWGVELRVGRQIHRLRDPFAALAAKLPPDRFLRLSSRLLLNVEELNALRPRING